MAKLTGHKAQFLCKMYERLSLTLYYPVITGNHSKVDRHLIC